jgi:PAS domain S-box-containing protein
MKKKSRSKVSAPEFHNEELAPIPLKKDVESSLRITCVILALCIIGIGITVLAGWITNDNLLTSIYPTLPSMKTNTAIAFILAGIAILASQMSQRRRITRYTRYLSAGIVAAIGALTLLQYLIGQNIGIDQLFFTEPPGAVGTASPNRMAPNSALLFILIGTALLFLDKKLGRFWTAHITIIPATIVLLPTILGYVYNIEFIYGVATTTKMAIHTALGFLLLIISTILTRPHHGFMTVILKDDAGGYLARRLVITSAIIPFILGWIILYGEQQKLYDRNFSFLLLIGSCVVVFTGLIWRNAIALSAVDDKRKRIEGFLAHMAAIVQSSDDAIISRTVDGKVLSWNKGAERIYGYTEEEMKGKSVSILIPKNQTLELTKLSKKLMKGERIDHLETVRTRKDRKSVNVSISFSPIRDNRGKIVAISTIARDITDQKRAEKVLQMRIRQQAVVSEIGIHALSGIELSRLMEIAVTKIAKVLNVEYAKVLELLPDGKELLLKAGYGWNKDTKVNISKVSAGKNSQAGYTLFSKKPVVVKDLSKEKRFTGPQLLQKHSVRSGMSCIIYGNSMPYGVLGVHTTERRDFTQHDLNFLQAIANVLAMTIERKNLERQKDDFISIASHELKTPVTSIKSFTQVLELRFKKEGNKDAANLLRKMDAQLNKLTNLIGDLLDITKIETGKMKYNNTNFSFDELVEELTEEMQRTTTKHKITVKGKTNAVINGDRERIGQVLTNLLSNAIKYSPHSDKIIIESSVAKRFVKLCVKDFGVGISKEKQQQVFERFFRITGPGRETYPGLGLGLYISSEIIKRQGGEIFVTSNEGVGSTFCFTIPLKKSKDKNNVKEV